MLKKKAIRTGKLKPVRFAPFFLDWTFKKVFGKAGGEPLLMALLNDFLKRVLPNQIRSVKYIPTELLGALPRSKKVIFDRIFSIAEISKLKGEDLKAYRYSMRCVDERKLAIDYAVEEATEIAFKQGVFKTAENMLKEGLAQKANHGIKIT